VGPNDLMNEQGQGSTTLTILDGGGGDESQESVQVGGWSMLHDTQEQHACSSVRRRWEEEIFISIRNLHLKPSASPRPEPAVPLQL